MRYYQEATILPSQEVSAAFIWTKAHRQLHIGLVAMKDENGNVPIGVSFPEYQLSPCGLGCKLRVFAEEESALAALGLEKLLARLRDYVHVTGIRPVPARPKGYTVYRRVHAAKSVAQKARRYAKRHGISYEEAETLFTQERPEGKLPYLQLDSLTNKNRFSLFIAKEEREQAVKGKFNVYGLSAEATVPEF